jgi:glycosyltransferase involved in cell wall biosynthesis
MNMERKQGVSVAMCTYNGEKYIEQQLQSIAAQTMLPLEIVICDDCSTDATPTIVADFARTAPFAVTFVVNPGNVGSSKKGITRNFEKASALCVGQYIAMCDQDDMWVPEKLARLVAKLESDPGFGGVFSDAQLMDPQSQPKETRLWETNGFSPSEQDRLQRGESLAVLLSMTKVYGCTLMVKADLLEKILPVPPSWWFDAWLANAIAVYAKLAFVPEPLLYYRIHPSQQVGAVAPSLKERLRKWQEPPQKHVSEAEPQLAELLERLQADSDHVSPSQLDYLRGRLALFRLRSELPASRLLRIGKVLPQLGNYQRYFNGWRSIVKDLTY